jgi:DNA repair protein RecN (Recombination protein N)
LNKEYLVIRREIAKEGKNRAFINSQMVPLPLIQSVGAHLIDLIGQHSHQILRSSEQQRSYLDLYGDCREQLARFRSAWETQKSQTQKLEALVEKNTLKERSASTFRRELDELEEANLKTDEEESLFEEYNRHSNAQELTEKIHQTLNILGASHLSKAHNLATGLSTLAPSLKDSVQLIQDASLAVEEVKHLLTAYLGKLDLDPKRFLFLEERLGVIHRIQRKYGPTFQQVLAYQKHLEEQLSQLDNLETEISDAQEQLAKAEQKAQEEATKLTAKRREAAKQLQKALTDSIQSLNMKGAELSIELTPHPVSSFGADTVHFWLKANVGERPGLVKECSSGGELSRMMFALKTTLAEKNQTPTIIFDEIDANVGGETAGIIGEKLHALASCRQVLCVTHFPQVACKADTHLSIQKQEVLGRTFAQISTLDKQQREQELIRMLGGSKTLTELPK